MLPPEYLAGLPDDLVELYGAVEGDILANMAERIAEYDYYIPAVQHQHQKLRAMGMLEGEIEERLSSLTGKSQRELRRLMNEAVEKSLTADAAVYAAAGMGPVDVTAVSGVRAVLRSGLDQTGGLFKNLTRTTANTAAKQFENALDRAWLQIASGGFDYHAAVRNAVKDLSRDGIRSIRYPTGHEDTLEVAVRRAVVTGCNQTAAKAQLVLMDELGADLVEVTAHAGARPSHAEWQGRVYSRSGKSGKYPDFVDSTGYGTGEGLCGWNCSHSFAPWFERAPRAYTPEMLEDYTAKTIEYNGRKMTEYEASQQQRYIERQIRRWKREYNAMEAAGQSTEEAAAKISIWREKEKEFCRQTGLKRQGDRSQIPDFSRSDASRAAYQAKERSKILANPGKNGILNDTNSKGIPVTDEAIRRVQLVRPEGWSQEHAERLQEAHRELLRAVKDKPVGTEAGAVYTLDMELIGRHIGADAGQAVLLPHLEEPHVLIHSHPSGLTFSKRDIENFVGNFDMTSFTAVGNNGAVYLLQKTESYDAAGFVKEFGKTILQLQQVQTSQEYANIINLFLEEAKRHGIQFITGG